ncbi:MAG TPA: hypothetical protein GX506_11860 [Firmicutes bacterium]|nr:hypothetical protein [Bacillota bacterium]
MQGDDVACLQARLNLLGYEAGEPDGYFGYLTGDAVKQFQAAHGLRQDGVAGPQVFAALLSKFALPRITHVTGPKETLSMVSQKYQVPVTLVAEANHLPVESRPYRSQRLIIPIRSVIAFYRHDHGSISPYLSLERNIKSITILSPMWVGIDTTGLVHSHLQDKAVSLAMLHEVDVMPAVSIADVGIPEADAVRAFLSSKKAREAAVKGLLELANRLKASGIVLCLTSVAPEDWYRGLSFVSNIAGHLHRVDKSLLAALPVEGLDELPAAYYEGVGRVADQVILLTFDQHNKEGKPGPIASIGWVREAIRKYMQWVPCWKTILTVPTYGYDWPELRREAPLPDSKASLVSYEEISALLSVFKPEVIMDEEALAPSFRYRSCRVTHRVFFENAVSVRAKVSLVHKYHLGGLALYYLGPEDPLIWSTIREGFKVRARMGRESQ